MSHGKGSICLRRARQNQIRRKGEEIWKGRAEDRKGKRERDCRKRERDLARAEDGDCHVSGLQTQKSAAHLGEVGCWGPEQRLRCG